MEQESLKKGAKLKRKEWDKLRKFEEVAEIIKGDNKKKKNEQIRAKKISKLAS